MLFPCCTADIADKHAYSPKNEQQGKNKIPKGNIEIEDITEQEESADDDQENTQKGEFLHNLIKKW